jgi:hypothetical protein
MTLTGTGGAEPVALVGAAIGARLVDPAGPAVLALGVVVIGTAAGVPGDVTPGWAVCVGVMPAPAADVEAPGEETPAGVDDREGELFGCPAAVADGECGEAPAVGPALTCGVGVVVGPVAAACDAV